MISRNRSRPSDTHPDDTASTRGFTLIELLVVIAIIALLSSVVLASLNTARAKARDAQRQSDAREIETALELYASDHKGAYPSTAGAWWGNSPGCYGGHASTGASASIPNLAPQYIPTIPQDPLLSVASSGHCYLYRSDGVNYKFLIHQTFETCAVGKCPMQDPARMSQNTGSVYSQGAKSW
jgi:prepilin-type N-terminal cleavage/methylation domain-containing protein